ncbi:hypothetical protein ACQ858_14785 [Variovorax ureilyticus]|uniref:hypothetical protein n=1 Tax=Variovorax ureilyticus TaxID=1836198 RepID=UPI003D673DED
MKNPKNEATRRGPPARFPEDPLLRALVAKAQARGDTLTELARCLGVTYERFAQLRRGKGRLKTARRELLANAARYLNVPVALVLVLVGIITLDDFSWPDESESFEAQLDKELEALRLDAFYGAFMPASLLTAPPGLKQYVLFMYREIQRDAEGDERGPKWLRLLYQATIANQEGAPDEGAFRGS